MKFGSLTYFIEAARVSPEMLCADDPDLLDLVRQRTQAIVQMELFLFPKPRHIGPPPSTASPAKPANFNLRCPRVPSAIVVCAIMILAGAAIYLGFMALQRSAPRMAQAFFGHTDTITSVSFSPDGRRIFSTSKDGSLRVWDIESTMEIVNLRHDIGDWGGVDATLAGDASCYVIVSAHGLRLLDTGTRKDLKALRLSIKPGRQKFSANHRRIIMGTPDNGVWVWDLPKDRTYQFNGHQAAEICCVGLSNDGQFGVSATADEIRLWEVENGRQLQAWQIADATSLAFSPDARSVFIGNNRGTLSSYDVRTGRPSVSLVGHRLAVTSLALSTDGKRLLSGSDDRTVRLWDVSTGKQLCSFDKHDGSITCIAFAPDDSSAVSGSADNGLWCWPLPR